MQVIQPTQDFTIPENVIVVHHMLLFITCCCSSHVVHIHDDEVAIKINIKRGN